MLIYSNLSKERMTWSKLHTLKGLLPEWEGETEGEERLEGASRGQTHPYVNCGSSTWTRVLFEYAIMPLFFLSLCLHLAESVWRLVLQWGETPLAVWQESTNANTAAVGHLDEWSPLSPFQETVHRQLLSWIISTRKRKATGCKAPGWCIFLFLCFVAILVSCIVSNRWIFFWQQTKTTCWYEVGRVLHVANHISLLHCASVCTKGVFPWEGRQCLHNKFLMRNNQQCRYNILVQKNMLFYSNTVLK